MQGHTQEHKIEQGKPWILVTLVVCAGRGRTKESEKGTLKSNFGGSNLGGSGRTEVTWRHDREERCRNQHSLWW